MSVDQTLEELLEIRSIRPASAQVRTCKSPHERETIKELAASIRQHGLIQPITVRPIDSGFEIVAGHRRYQACKLLRWRVIPARMKALSDKEAFEVQLVENMHRLSMDPVEEAEAFKKYVVDYGWGGVSQLSRVLSKSEQYISSRIQLLKLPKEIIEEVSENRLRPSHALEIVNLDEEYQKPLAETVMNGNLSVQHLRQMVKKVKDGKEVPELISFNGVAELGGYKKDQTNIAEVKLLKRTLLVLRMSLARLDSLINEANGKLDAKQRTEVVGILMQYRLKLHTLIDDNIKSIASVSKKLDS